MVVAFVNDLGYLLVQSLVSRLVATGWALLGLSEVAVLLLSQQKEQVFWEYCLISFDVGQNFMEFFLVLLFLWDGLSRAILLFRRFFHPLLNKVKHLSKILLLQLKLYLLNADLFELCLGNEQLRSIRLHRFCVLLLQVEHRDHIERLDVFIEPIDEFGKGLGVEYADNEVNLFVPPVIELPGQLQLSYLLREDWVVPFESSS